MQLQVGHTSEPLLTYVARNRLTGVDSHVRLQVGGPREIFPANGARERPFARVNLHVLSEDALTSEPLLADFAFKRPFARMGPQMPLEVAQLTERLFASFALENLHSVLPLLSVRWRLVSFALDPSSRTDGTDRTAAGRRASSLTDFNTKIKIK